MLDARISKNSFEKQQIKTADSQHTSTMSSLGTVCKKLIGVEIGGSFDLWAGQKLENVVFVERKTSGRVPTEWLHEKKVRQLRGEKARDLRPSSFRPPQHLPAN